MLRRLLECMTILFCAAQSSFCQSNATASVTINGNLQAVTVTSGVHQTAASASPLSSFVDSNGASHTYFIDSNQHVYHLFWNATSGWTNQDLTAITGNTLAAANSKLSSVFNNLDGSSYVFYQGANQHIYELFCCTASGWMNADLTAATGNNLPASGTDLASFATNTANTNPVMLYYFDTNQHVNTTYLMFDTGIWLNKDLTAVTSATPASSGSSIATMFAIDGTTHVFYEGSNQHIYHFDCCVAGQWSNEDLTGSTGNNLAATGTKLSILAPVSGSVTALVFYEGPNQHIYTTYYSSSPGWQTQDLTASTGNILAASGTALTSTITAASGAWYVTFVGAANQHIYTLYCCGWGIADLNANAGSSIVAGSGTGLSSVGAADNLYMHEFYLNSSQHVYDLYYNLSLPGWLTADLTSSSNPRLVDAGTASVTINGPNSTTFTATACYGTSTTPGCVGSPVNATANDVAAALAQALNASGSPVSATSFANTAYLTWRTSGSIVASVNPLVSTPDNASVFPGGSFSSTATNFAAGMASPISQENQAAGTSDWQITHPICDTSNCAQQDIIEGYASRTSVNKGEQIKLYVSANGTSVPYTIKVFRVGWYQGLGGRLMAGPISLTASQQSCPAPDSLGLIDCAWSETDAYTLTVPSTWTSGIYLAKLERSDTGSQRYIIFIVRDDSRPSLYLYQSSFATFQAYNDWGGRGLYTSDDSTPPNKTGFRASFNRPYHDGLFLLPTAEHINNGAGQLFSREIRMVRWLERQGYDVSYIADVDLHSHPDLPLNHHAVLVVGHSEYWSWPMRSSLERARETGVSLGFFCGNCLYWQVRLDPSNGVPDRIMTCYADNALDISSGSQPHDPYADLTDPTLHRLVTAHWSNQDVWKPHHSDPDPINRPEESLMGVAYELQQGPDGTSDFKTNFIADMVTTDPSMWPNWLSQLTGLSANSPLHNLVGYEADKMHGFQPAGTIGITHSIFPNGVPASHQFPADSTLYTAPSGAVVFATGSVYWERGLDEYGNNPAPPSVFHANQDHGAQQITANFLSNAAQIPPVPASARLAATVTASSSAAGYPAANAGDGNLGSQWVASLTPQTSNNYAWLQLDFGVRRFVQRVKWVGATGTPYPAASPTNYSILVSDDAVNWRTLVTRTNSSQVVNGNELLNWPGRYLRFSTTQVNDGTGWSLSFFEFWAEGGAAPPSGRLKASAAAGLSNADGLIHPDTYAVDLDFTTQWTADSGGAQSNNYGWYQIDLGIRKQIDRLKWAGATGSSFPANSPTNYSIFVSDDGTNWYDIVDRVNASPVINGDEAINTQARYVAIGASLIGNGNGWTLSFFEIWAEGYDSDNVLGATASASSEAAGYPASNALDGNMSTQWLSSVSSSTANNNAWFQLDFGVWRKQIDRVRWVGGSGTPSLADSPTNYSIEVSDDGVNWQTVVTRTNTAPVVNGYELLNAQGRYLRIQTTQVGDGTGNALSFFEFWADGY
jgi:hypothetical protein